MLWSGTMTTQTSPAKSSSPERKLRVIQTSAGTKAQYTRLLLRMVRELSAEVAEAVKKMYRAELPEIVGDESPADRLAGLFAEQRTRFAARIDVEAPRLAEWFTERVRQQVTAAQRSMFAAAGIEGLTVGFETGTLTQNAVQAIVAENVNLIKSIGSQYLTDVEGIVMRSVLAGRDLKTLGQELRGRYDITARRAALIARDQSNKATQAISRANSLDAGLTRAEWIHIPGRKSSRRSHEAMHGKQFDLTRGMYDPEVKKRIQPGELVACNCSYRLVIDKKLWKKLDD
jgi:uncharacterized protein with gpF-like domain